MTNIDTIITDKIALLGTERLAHALFDNNDVGLGKLVASFTTSDGQFAPLPQVGR